MRSLIGMYDFVILQLSKLRKRLTADITAVRLLSRMSIIVAFQSMLMVGRVVATLTLVLAVPVDVAVTPPHVPVQAMLSQTLEVTVHTAQ